MWKEVETRTILSPKEDDKYIDCKVVKFESYFSKNPNAELWANYKYEIIEDHSITHYLLIRYCSNESPINIHIV